MAVNINGGRDSAIVGRSSVGIYEKYRSNTQIVAFFFLSFFLCVFLSFFPSSPQRTQSGEEQEEGLLLGMSDGASDAGLKAGNVLIPHQVGHGAEG